MFRFGRPGPHAPAFRIRPAFKKMEERTSGPRCAYCAKLLEPEDAIVVIVPNRPVRRLRYAHEAELPGAIAIHERCYEQRDLTRNTRRRHS